MIKYKQPVLLKLNKHKIIFIILSKLLVLNSYSQIIIQNPSFEGINPGPTPPLWTTCLQSPDTQPGGFCISLPPSDGNSYLGLGANSTFDGIERVGQMLTVPFQKGKTYMFQIDLSMSNSSIPNCGGFTTGYIDFQVWGGTSLCGKSKLLWRSDTIKHIGWRTYTIIFSPDSNYTHILFQSNSLENYNSYILVDNMSYIYEVKPQTWFTSPNSNTNQSCTFNVTGKTDSIPSSIQLTGKFNGTPLTAIFNSADTSWQASLTYPTLFTGIDTIIVIGTFANGYIAGDTLIINIPAMAGFTIDSFCLGDSTVFIDTSITVSGNIIERKWNFGDGNNLIKTSGGILKHEYQNSAAYNVSLRVLTDQGCIDSISKQIIIIDCDPPQNIFIPNLITPNADGKNDVFEIKNLPLNSYLEIFNRWGEKVYESDNYKNNWKGERDGIYFYFIKIEGKNFKGWVEVRR